MSLHRKAGGGTVSGLPLRNLLALLLLALLVLGIQGAIGLQLDRAQRERAAEQHRADSLQIVADRAEQWAKRQTWATGYYLRDKLNADQALRQEREKCGAW
jgi:hypothetical protein